MDDVAIDPEIAGFITQMRAGWADHPGLDTVTVPEARAIAEQVREPWRRGAPVMRHVREETLSLPSGHLRIRVLYPDDRPLVPALIYLHGGGWTLFSIDTHDRLMREYAAAGGFAVVAVDYPLSPEAKFPLALNLIVELTDWLMEHGADTGIDATRLVIGGDSAGGNLSLATAMRLRDAGQGDRLRGILSNYGALGRRCSDESEARFGGPDAVLNRAEMEYFWGNYLADAKDSEDPYACPLIGDVAGLPPTLLVVAEVDILAEDSHILERRMAAAGTPVDLRVYHGATHSFLEAMSVAAIARTAIGDAAAWLQGRLTSD